MAMVNVTEDICKERHRRIDECLNRLDDGQSALGRKVDDMMGVVTDIRILFQSVSSPFDSPVHQPLMPGVDNGHKQQRVDPRYQPYIIGTGLGGGLVLLLEAIRMIIQALQ